MDYFIFVFARENDRTGCMFVGSGGFIWIFATRHCLSKTR